MVLESKRSSEIHCDYSFGSRWRTARNVAAERSRAWTIRDLAHHIQGLDWTLHTTGQPLKTGDMEGSMDCSESGVRGNKTGKMRIEQRWNRQAMRFNQL